MHFLHPEFVGELPICKIPKVGMAGQDVESNALFIVITSKQGKTKLKPQQDSTLKPRFSSSINGQHKGADFILYTYVDTMRDRHVTKVPTGTYPLP